MHWRQALPIVIWWMFITTTETLLLSLKGKSEALKVHENDRKHLQFNIPWLNSLFLLGLPAFVVSISLAATQGRGYTDMRTCWLNTRNHVLWAFVVPALLIVSVSLAALQDFHQLEYPRLNASTMQRLLYLALIAKCNQNVLYNHH